MEKGVRNNICRELCLLNGHINSVACRCPIFVDYVRIMFRRKMMRECRHEQMQFNERITAEGVAAAM